MPQQLLQSDGEEATDSQTKTDGGDVETERTLDEIIRTHARE